MPEADGERIARLEARQQDMRRDIDELRTAQRADHHLIRNAEAAVNSMVQATRDARRAEDRQYRRLEMRIQYGGLAMAAAMVFLGVVQILVSFHH